MFDLFIILVVLIFFSFNLGTDYFNHKWWFATQTIITIIAYNVYLHSGLALSLFLFYLMTSSAFYSINNQKNHIARVVKNYGFECMLYRSLLASMSFSVFFVLVPHGTIEAILKGLPIALFLSCLLFFLSKKQRTVISHKGNNVEIFGFSINSSIDNTFRSLLAVLCLYWFDDYPLLIGSLLAINFLWMLKAKGTSGIAGFLAGILYFTVIHKGFWEILLMLVPASIIYYKFFDKNFFDDSGRIKAYKFFHEHLYPVMKNKWTGLGVGSFLNMGGTIQKVKKEGFGCNGVFLWLHCDLLQAFYEGGIVMLVLGFAMVLEAVYGGNPVVISYAICWFVNSLTYFPNHMAPDQFLNLVALKLAHTSQALV